MSTAAPRYIISRGLDPVFGIGVGLTAALLKINRDEKDKGHSTQKSFDDFKRRVRGAWEEVMGKSAAG